MNSFSMTRSEAERLLLSCGIGEKARGETLDAEQFKTLAKTYGELERLIVATSNKGKKREFEEMLPEMNVVCFKDLGLSYEIEETGATFYDNALIKAERVKKDFPTDYVLADDSGLEVEALGGAPGVYTARYAGENATDDDNIDKLLSALGGKENRRARFVCSLVCIAPDGKIISAEGESRGRQRRVRLRPRVFQLRSAERVRRMHGRRKKFRQPPRSGDQEPS